ncbi:MAG TPA: hypothetical protein VJ810_12930 [Blastocatellia bacterium]|nr:hypothetical protein [Blastocatellia bacterium]
MKVDWLAHSLRGIYLLVGTGILAIVWTWLKWPWAGVVRVLPLLFAAYAFLASYFVKRERLRREQLREEIRGLGDNLILKGDFTVDDLDLLYKVEELEQIVVLLKAMPTEQRRLQAAVDAVEKHLG